MEYTFVEIEKKKSYMVWFLMLFLTAFYFMSAWVIFLIIKNILALIMSLTRTFTPPRTFSLTLLETSIIFAITATLAFLHLRIARFLAVDKILFTLKSMPLDRENEKHEMLRSLVEEISLACKTKNVETYIIPETYVNIFSLNDYSARKVVGVTEGLLEKCDMGQLRALIADEIVFILKGYSLSSTVNSAVFELYRAIFKDNKSAALNLVLAVINFMSFIASTFISPKEKYEADDISSQISRDPLTLAEALNVISRDLKERKAGEMILPSIFIASPLPTHPPVDRRIDTLLKAANKDRTALEGI